MSEAWIALSLVTAVISIVLSRLPARRRAAAVPLVSGALAASAAALLGSIADGRVWGADAVMASIANGSHAVDPRMWAAAVVALASLLASPAIANSLGGARSGLVSTLTPGIVMVALVTGSAAFLGQRATPALAASALGALALGVALTLALRAIAVGGHAPWRSFVAAGAALVAVAAALGVYGARSEPLDLAPGGSAEALGVRLFHDGDTALGPERRRLNLRLRDARGERRLAPELWRRAGGAMRGVGAAGMFGGPVVVPIGLREIPSGGHAVEWVAEGDSLVIAGGSVRFDGFRIEGRDTIRIFADLVVRRGDHVDRVSPGVIASHRGEQAFSDQIAGFGRVAVAGIDADHHRVGLVLPGGMSKPLPSTAVVLIRDRPMLPAAWAGAALALMAFLLSLWAGRGSAPTRDGPSR